MPTTNCAGWPSLTRAVLGRIVTTGKAAGPDAPGMVIVAVAVDADLVRATGARRQAHDDALVGPDDQGDLRDDRQAGRRLARGQHDRRIERDVVGVGDRVAGDVQTRSAGR